MNHADWHGRGWHNTHPIIPPLAALTNPFNKKLADNRGKVPGLMRESGRWSSYDWRTLAPPSVVEMDAWGAGVGIRTDGLLIADGDCLCPIISAELRQAAEEILGPGALRIGQAPKWMMFYAAAEPMTKLALKFRRPGAAPDSKAEGVELLADGQQVVLDGLHKATRQPHVWPNGRPRRADLVLVTAAQRDLLLQRWREILERHGCTVEEGRHGGGGGDRTQVDQASLLAPSEAVLVDALRFVTLDPNDRDLWIDCGQAIHAAGGTWEHWLDVSNRVATEDPDDVQRRFAGFKPPHVLGWWWIERRARAAGWLGSAKLDFAAVDAPVLKAVGVGHNGGPPLDDAAGGTLQERMFGRYVWVSKLKRVADLETGELMDREQFNVEMAAIGHPLVTKQSAFGQLVSDPRLRKFAGVTYRPGQKREVIEPGIGLCFNRWRSADFTPDTTDSEAKAKWWLDHLAFLVPDAEMREHVLDVMCHIVQHPGVKINHALVFGGLPRIGKDMLWEPIRAVLGAHNVKEIGVEHLQGQYNDWVENKQVVFVQEMHTDSRVHLINKMKKYVAAPPPYLPMDVKYLPEYSIPNIVIMVIFTNRQDAIPIEKGEGRYCILWCDAERRERAYYKHGWDLLRSGGLNEAVVGYLAQRQIRETFDAGAPAPHTAAKDRMALDARSELQALVEDTAEAQEWPDLVNPEDIAKRLSHQDGPRGRAISGQSVARVLRSIGARPVHDGAMVRLPVPTKSGADRARIYSIRNHDKYVGMAAKALARDFVEGWAKIDKSEIPKNAFRDFQVVTESTPLSRRG